MKDGPLPKNAPLDELGILHGTDKSSLRQNYLVHYERLFRPFRDRKISVIEIGVYNGASLALWESYFRNATIVGLDIEPSCVQYGGGRKIIEIGSQTDPVFLDRVLDAHQPAIVIDDGSHRHADMVFTFEHVFPRLASGGCYVIEDFNGAFSPLAAHFGGTDQCNAVEYFGRLQMGLMSRWSYKPEGLTASESLTASIARMETFGNCVAICKEERTGRRPDVGRIENLVAGSGRPESWMFLAEYLMNVTQDYEAALRAVMRGITQTPQDPWLHHRASEILERSGDMDAAADAANRAAALRPQEPFLRERAARLEDARAATTRR